MTTKRKKTGKERAQRDSMNMKKGKQQKKHRERESTEIVIGDIRRDHQTSRRGHAVAVAVGVFLLNLAFFVALQHAVATATRVRHLTGPTRLAKVALAPRVVLALFSVVGEVQTVAAVGGVQSTVRVTAQHTRLHTPNREKESVSQYKALGSELRV
jgi:hypothetical protein